MNVLTSKKFQLAVALLLCAAILAGGSFAWFSLNQNVLNEFSWNPEGANLHDDFTDPNKDVYVENTGTLPLLVRVQLREFMQYGRSPATAIPTDATQADKTSWPAHSGDTTAADCDNGFHDYWTWTMGGEKWYVPADADKISAIRGHGDDEDSYSEKDPVVNNPINEDGLPKALKDRYASYAALTQAIANDTVMQGHLTTLSGKKAALTAAIEAYSQAPMDTAKAEALKAARDEHYAAQTAANKYALETFGVQQSRPAEIKLMSEWEADPKLGDFWVIDTNGWCYWASPLEAGEATGLLLDKVEATAEINALKAARQPYYYGIDVTMQAATADDVEKYWNETYAGTGQAATVSAQELLQKIAAVCASSEALSIAEDAGTFGLFGLRPEENDDAHSGDYWYQNRYGDWYYDDGRWTYNGWEWLLDGEEYPFDWDRWHTYEGTDEAYYIDDYWVYIDETWRPAGGNPDAIHPDDIESKPEAPDFPEIPDTPDVPETPDTPETPEAPDAPDTPETPETPEAPDTPETPDIPETSETPDTPVSPEVPEAPDTGAADKPSETEEAVSETEAP